MALCKRRLYSTEVTRSWRSAVRPPGQDTCFRSAYEKHDRPLGTYQALTVSGRRYASSSATAARISSTVEEHSPGNNVATIAVSNPSKLNIVNSALLGEFKEICEDLAQDTDLRAVILTGAPTAPGKAASFIGGADIKEMITLSSAEEARAFITRIHAACDAFRAIPVPVIAKINGFCLGAGLEIAAACDLRVATKDSVFGMPEVAVGIPSVVEAAYLPGLIGWGRTRRMLYLAERVDCRTAERWGFVEEVVDDSEALDAMVGKWTDLLIGMGPKAVRSQKVLIQKWEEGTMREGIEAGVDAFAEAFQDCGKEPKEMMGHFVGRKR